MQKPFIPVILGTARKGRQSEAPAQFVFSELQQRDDIETEFVDVRDHVSELATVPPWGEGGANENSTKWKEIASRADAFIFVLPEYNHGYPGELKLLFDSLYDEYFKKPVALCGVSAGIFGGSRVVDHIKPALIEAKMVPIRSAMYFGQVKSVFKDGVPIDSEEQQKRLNGVLEELLWYASALKKERE